MLIEILSGVLLFGGSCFLLIGSIGLLRMPEFYTRTHAASVIDTMAVALILLGLLLLCTEWIVAVKLMLVLLFLLITGPTATHALAKSALHGRLDSAIARVLETPAVELAEGNSSPENAAGAGVKSTPTQRS